MQKKEMLSELEKFLDSIGIKVKYENIKGDGGYCKYKDKEYVILNRILPLSTRTEMIKGIVREIVENRADIYVLPVVREIIGDEQNNQ